MKITVWSKKLNKFLNLREVTEEIIRINAQSANNSGFSIYLGEDFIVTELQ